MKRIVNSFPSILFHILIIGLIFFFRYPTIFYHYADWDEAAMMSEAWAMTKGQVLYKDIYHVHPIFQFFIFVPFFLLSPPDLTPHLIKIFNIFLIYLGAIYIRKIASKALKDSLAGTAGSIFFILYLGVFPWTHSSYGEFYTIFPVLFLLYLLFSQDILSKSASFTIGALAGIAIFTKQTALFDILPIFLMHLLLFENSPSRRSAHIKFTTLGFSFIFILAFIYPLWHSSARLAFTSMFLHNVSSYVSPHPTVAEQTKTSLWVFISSVFFRNSFLYVYFYRFVLQNIYITSAFLFPVIPGALRFCFLINRNRFSSHLKILLLTSVWIVTIFLGISLIGRFYSHYFTQLAPALALLFAISISFTSPWLKNGYVLLLILFSITFGFIHFKDLLSDMPPVPEIVAESKEISEFIGANTNSGDKIFLLREDSLDIYYLSQRLSCNGIYMDVDMDSAHTHDFKGESVYRKRFLDNLPKIIVKGNKGWLPNSTSAIFFTKILRVHYELYGEIQKRQIYFLKGSR